MKKVFYWVRDKMDDVFLIFIAMSSAALWMTTVVDICINYGSPYFLGVAHYLVTALTTLMCIGSAMIIHHRLKRARKAD